MDVHASEKEQVEALKNWWKENGSSVITGVLLGLSVLLGGKAWFGYQENQKLSASNTYAQMMAVSAVGENEKGQDVCQCIDYRFYIVSLCASGGNVAGEAGG